jgi:hypothetical protein
MTECTVGSLAGLIRQLNGMAESDKVIARAQSVFRLLICVREAKNS